jgi:hypothetical protein
MKTQNTPNDRLFLLTYDYGESGRTQRYAFLCEASSLRQAAELFWQQHPAQWYTLQRATDGNFEAFWDRGSGQFVTVPPGRESDAGGGMSRTFSLEHEALHALSEVHLLERTHSRPHRRRQERGKEKLE